MMETRLLLLVSVMLVVLVKMYSYDDNFTGRQTDRQTDRQTHMQTDRQTHMQTDRHTDTRKTVTCMD